VSKGKVSIFEQMIHQDNQLPHSLIFAQRPFFTVIMFAHPSLIYRHALLLIALFKSTSCTGLVKYYGVNCSSIIARQLMEVQERNPKTVLAGPL